jgi:hypothetical protein
MSGWETFDWLCHAADLEASIAALPDQQLYDLRECLENLAPEKGVPAMIEGLATLEAAKRWQGGGQ